MRVLLLFIISIFLVNCTLNAESGSIHHEFDNWIHMEVKEDNLDLVFSLENSEQMIIFIVDPDLSCDARLVYTNRKFEPKDFDVMGGETFDWKLSGQSYEGKDASRLNVDGYVRWELMSFYKHHFSKLEDLLSTRGQISFSVNDPLNRFEKQEIQMRANGLSSALVSALDTCQGWT